MSEPLTMNFSVVVERDATDLETCLMILRNVSKRYPQHFDIALNALQAEYRLPQLQQVIDHPKRG